MSSSTLNDRVDTSTTRFRNLVALACLSCLSFATVRTTITKSATENDIQHSTHNAIEGGNQKFHQSGFGGIYNINHPAGARARRELSAANVVIPVSAVKHAIPSLSAENIQNLHGHYVHDEHRSPFASFLYDKTKEELDAEQKEYEEKMAKIREEWGAWDFKDEHPEIRPIANFAQTPYKDMMNADFPSAAWQMDQKYVTDLIAEGRKLVDRVREGIYAEYGYATKDLTDEEIEARSETFKVFVTEKPEAPKEDGMAFINQKGLDMYARKLLHAMMTNDEFYYIMGGHSAAAGHGNNFIQTYMMEFANIMEPVLHKLGVRLIARNLAMGGLGTIHYSLGAATLYGETDVMMWDSSMTEKSREDQDLFHKQALLGGERVPVLLGGAVNDLQTETGDNLWYGSTQFGNYNWDLVPLTTDLDQAEELPWAAQYVRCDPTVADLCKQPDHKYHDSCWIPRSDVNETTVPLIKKMPEKGGVKGKASWHPGDRNHKFDARKQTFLMLHALDAAFDMWEKGIADGGFPLKEEYWHVGEHYINARTSLTNYINNEGFNTTACEKRWAARPGLDKACRMSLKGLSEFTPINRGYHNSIHAHLKAAPNGYKPAPNFELAYEGIDVLPPFWKIPEGHIDVHAIAIASTYGPPELDQSWAEDGDDTEGADASRRMLRKAATERIVASPEPLTSEVDKERSARDERVLASGDEVIPGQGWAVYYPPGEDVTGYCDGSPMSGDCARAVVTQCLLSGHNDKRGAVQGDGLSGWVVITVPEVKEGLIFAKLQGWWPRNISGQHPRTEGWTEVNNGITYEGEDGDRRQMKAKPLPWSEDLQVDVAINGEIIKVLDLDWMTFYSSEMAYNEAFYPLVDDEDLVKGDEAEPVELGLRLRSMKDPRNAGFQITHIYYA